MAIFLGAIKNKKSFEIGSLVRVIKTNKSGFILDKDGGEWYVKFPDKTSDFFSSKELQLID